MMKTKNIISVLVILLLMVFNACREVTVTTKINPDGSFTRIIRVSGDSSDVFKTGLPFPVDESWVVVSSKDSTDSTKYVVTYTRSFRNSDELNDQVKNDSGDYKNLEREISITKKFRFFFSYITFKEVYKSCNPFPNRDYRDYLTEDDIRFYSGLKIPVTHADSMRKDQAEEKVTAYFLNAAIDEVESILKDGIQRLDNPKLQTSSLLMYHDSISNKLADWDFSGKDDFIASLTKWSGDDSYKLLTNLDPPLFEDYNKKMNTLERVIEIEGYTEEVEMPGLLTGTNSTMLKGNTVSWEFQASSVLVRDFEMYAESRVINYWVFILAGIVLLALLVLLVIKSIGR